jgi:hypothetical protein
LGKKVSGVYTWGRRIGGFTVGEEGLRDLQLGKKDWGI